MYDSQTNEFIFQQETATTSERNGMYASLEILERAKENKTYVIKDNMNKSFWSFMNIFDFGNNN